MSACACPHLLGACRAGAGRCWQMACGMWIGAFYWRVGWAWGRNGEPNTGVDDHRGAGTETRRRKWTQWACTANHNNGTTTMGCQSVSPITSAQIVIVSPRAFLTVGTATYCAARIHVPIRVRIRSTDQQRQIPMSVVVRRVISLPNYNAAS